MNLLRNTLFPVTILLGILPGAHAADRLSPAGFHAEAWRIEKPDPDASGLSARLNGEASHGNKTTAAILQVSCLRSPLRPAITLLTSTDELGFNPDAFEGPDAPSNGPISFDSSTFAPRNYPVNGFYTRMFSQKHDVAFNFSISANRQELQYWTSETTRGQPLTMTLASTVKGAPPLIARFVLPQDDRKLRKIAGPCMKVSE